jgi:hypothetical protein
MSFVNVVTDRLVDFMIMARDSSVVASSKSKTKDKREDKKRKKKIGGGIQNPLTRAIDKGKDKQLDTSRKKSKSNACYFICGGPHHIRKCLKMKKLNVMLVNDSEGEETIMHVNPIRVLNYLITKLEGSMDESSLVKSDLVQIDALRQWKLGAVETLIYTKIRVNDQDITIMLDSSVMNTFIVDGSVM